MRKFPLLLILALAAGMSVPAAAGKILYFTNGTAMEVRSIEYDGEMITVDLDEGASMAFPAAMVERVEEAEGETVGIRGKSLTGRRSTRTSSNSRASAAAGPSTKAPQAEVPARGRIETDDNGVVTERPFADSKHPGRSQMRATGSQAARRGTQPGNRTMDGRAGAGAGKVVLPSYRGRQREAQQGPEIKGLQFDPKPLTQSGPPAPSNDPGSKSDKGGSDN